MSAHFFLKNFFIASGIQIHVRQLTLNFRDAQRTTAPVEFLIQWVLNLIFIPFLHIFYMNTIFSGSIDARALETQHVDPPSRSCILKDQRSFSFDLRLVFGIYIIILVNMNTCHIRYIFFKKHTF